MQEKLYEDVMTIIRRLFDKFGGRAYAGERVTQLEHALQCAALAESESASPALVAAALLHDIGHILDPHDEAFASKGLDARHEDAGEIFLAQYFGPEVSEPVRLHVAAKRYLCAVEPDYAAGLSPASRLSLRLQGGPFTPDEVRCFEQEPWFRSAVAVRRWDDAAKVPGLAVPGLEHYRSLLEAVLRQREEG